MNFLLRSFVWMVGLLSISCGIPQSLALRSTLQFLEQGSCHSFAFPVPMGDLPDMLVRQVESPGDARHHTSNPRGLRKLCADRCKIHRGNQLSEYERRIFFVHIPVKGKCMPSGKKNRTPEAERIFQLRKQLGVDQNAFARQLKVNQGTISKWENGEAKPGPHTYIQLAELAVGDLKRLLRKDGGIGEGGRQPPREETEKIPSWDPELLIFVIGVIDEELEKRARKLPSRKYAEMVVLFYEFCHQTGRRDSDMVGRLLMIA